MDKDDDSDDSDVSIVEKRGRKRRGGGGNDSSLISTLQTALGHVQYKVERLQGFMEQYDELQKENRKLSQTVADLKQQLLKQQSAANDPSHIDIPGSFPDGLVESEIHERLSKEQAAQRDEALRTVAEGDPKYAMQLREEIEDLKREIEDLARVKRRNVQMNQQAIDKLVRSYGLEVPSDNVQSRVVAHAVLQRRIIDIIHGYLTAARRDFAAHHKEKPPSELNVAYLEYSAIENATKLENTIDCLLRLHDSEKADNDIARWTKARQQLYSVLSKLSFGPRHMHVRDVSSELLAKLNDYRTVTDDRLRDSLEEAARNVVRRFANIMNAGLHTVPFVPKMEFPKPNTLIDTDRMEVTGENADNHVVGLCYFPLVIDAKGSMFSKANVISKEADPKGLTYTLNSILRPK